MKSGTLDLNSLLQKSPDTQTPGGSLRNDSELDTTRKAGHLGNAPMRAVWVLADTPHSVSISGRTNRGSLLSNRRGAAYKRKHPSADRNQLSRIFVKDE